MQEPGGARLVALCVGADDPHGLARFWAEALRWELGEPSGDDVWLSPADGTGFALRFVPATPGQTGRKRLHLDLTTSSWAEQAASVERLLEHGARHHDVGQSAEESHVVLADPEGNELCLVGPENRFLAGCPRLGAISCDGTRAVGVFWSDALGWPLIWDQDEETAIRASGPSGATGSIVSWGGPPVIEKVGANRLHLDLAPSPGTDPEAVVDRLVALGATRDGAARRHGDGIALLDPDGNELCVLASPAGS